LVNGEIMKQKFIFAGAAALGMLAALTSRAYAGADDYLFEAVQPEIKASNVATLAVRLVHKTGKAPVTTATLLHTRIEMAPDEDHQMSSAIAPLPSREPGVFAFKAPLTMEGRWLLTVAATIPGEPEPIEGKIIFRTRR
jgi:YtkA-like